MTVRKMTQWAPPLEKPPPPPQGPAAHGIGPSAAAINIKKGAHNISEIVIRKMVTLEFLSKAKLTNGLLVHRQSFQ
jgi:hypothetical protein